MRPDWKKKPRSSNLESGRYNKRNFYNWLINVIFIIKKRETGEKQRKIMDSQTKWFSDKVELLTDQVKINIGDFPSSLKI